MQTADFVIIGSGQGGVPLAAKLAEKGHDVVIFERANWGGTCVNTGCIPSKTLLASAHAAAAARNARSLGVTTEVTVNFKAVIDRVRESIQPEGIVEWLKDSGVQLIEAEARFIGPHTVQGGDVTVEAERIVINTGKSPFVPDIPGLADTPYHTYQTIWQIDKLPEKALVLGGGYTGLELAQALQRLGSQVHVIEIHKRVISDEEEDIGQTLQQALEADGVQFHFGTEVQQVAYSNNDRFELTFESAKDPLTGDMLLVATGRRPNIHSLELNKVGISLDEHDHIKVDEQFRTSVEGVYAIGDVTGQPAFTHVSWEDHRRLLAILEGDGRFRGDRVLGYAFFTEPQVGRVGLSLTQAEEKGYEAKSVTLPLTAVARAAATNHTNGFYRLVIDEETNQILGATLVGPQAAELVHIILAHMEAGSTWQILERSQHIHPSYAEDLPTLARKFEQ